MKFPILMITGLIIYIAGFVLLLLKYGYGDEVVSTSAGIGFCCVSIAPIVLFLAGKSYND